MIPDRDPQDPLDVDPRARSYREAPAARTDWGAAAMIGLIALFVAFGFVFYMSKDSDRVAVDDRPPIPRSETTGTRSSEMPLPNTPTPPTLPSPPRPQ